MRERKQMREKIIVFEKLIIPKKSENIYVKNT